MAQGYYLKLTLSCFLNDREQSVTLNGQVSSWTGPLLFLVLSISWLNSISSNAKIFADDTSLFLVKHNATELNNDLHKINCWTFLCKNEL